MDKDTLLQQNPKADSGKVSRALAILERLKRAGLRGKGYDLARPIGVRGRPLRRWNKK